MELVEFERDTMRHRSQEVNVPLWTLHQKPQFEILKQSHGRVGGSDIL